MSTKVPQEDLSFADQEVNLLVLFDWYFYFSGTQTLITQLIISEFLVQGAPFWTGGNISFVQLEL